MKKYSFLLVFLLLLTSCSSTTNNIPPTDDISCSNLYDNIELGPVDMQTMWFNSGSYDDLPDSRKYYLQENEAFWREFIKANMQPETEADCMELKDCEMRKWCIAKTKFNADPSYCLGNDENACILFNLEKNVGLTPTTNEHLVQCDAITIDWVKQYCKEKFKRKE